MSVILQVIVDSICVVLLFTAIYCFVQQCKPICIHLYIEDGNTLTQKS